MSDRVPFPRPERIGPHVTRWRRSSIRAYEAALRGEPPRDLDPADEQYLTVREVAERYRVGIATIWRWAADTGAAE